jgi:hypothetical protein
MFSNLTPDEAGRLDSVMFGALTEMPDHYGAEDSPAEDALGVLDDLRTQHAWMPPDTASFRLDQL